MKKREKIILSLIENRRIIKWALIASAILMLIVASAIIFWLNHDNKIETSVDERINITPTQIRQIENIGQWEFLSISDEEMIDTTRRGFFSDAQLVRIYYGTLRLGIELKKTTPHWLRVEADTLLVATLPPIQLLDYNFIDEAQTKSFIQSGSWNPSDLERLYQKAHKTMLKRCLTQQNIDTAKENAELQFTRLLNSMGFKATRIEWQE